MRMICLATIAAASLVATPALADEPGRGWISAARVTDMLAKRGYKVSKIKADDGRWKGEAVRGRQKFQFDASPTDGTITKLERD